MPTKRGRILSSFSSGTEPTDSNRTRTETELHWWRAPPALFETKHVVTIVPTELIPSIAPEKPSGGKHRREKLAETTQNCPWWDAGESNGGIRPGPLQKGPTAANYACEAGRPAPVNAALLSWFCRYIYNYLHTTKYSNDNSENPIHFRKPGYYTSVLLFGKFLILV
jgi:hypothetical protein